MSNQLDSFRYNAAAARTEAETATLPNVRAKAAEAALRWSELAKRLERVEEHTRQKREAGRVY